MAYLSASPSAYPPSDEADLFTAAQRGEESGVALLLRGGVSAAASLDASTGWSALHAALINGHGRVAEQLLKAGSSATAVDRRGNTPLHACAAGAACVDGDEVGLSVAKMLLLAGGVRAASAANEEGVTPLHLAAQRGKCSLIELLVEHGASLSAHNRDGHDPFFFRANMVTERTLLRLLSASALDTSGRIPAPRSRSRPWNLAEPGPSAAPRASEPSSRDRGTADAGPRLLPPPHTVPAPQPPGPAPDPYSTRRRAPRAGSGPAAAAPRSGRTLTADEERRATLLAKYLAPKPAPGAPPPRPASAGGTPTHAKPTLVIPSAVAPKEKLSIEEKLRRAFFAADRDGSRTVSKRELFRAMVCPLPTEPTPTPG